MGTNFLTKLKTAGKRREIEVEYEGQKFTLRDMTGAMRDFWDQDSKQRIKFKGKHPDLNTMQLEGQRALMVAMTLVDDTTGELAFDYKSAEDLETLCELSGGLLDSLFDSAVELCGIGAKAAKESEGN